MFIERAMAQKLRALAEKFPVVTLTGPRQSGKTTLLKALFPTLPYASLEAPDIRQFALTDPRGFLANFNQGAILDEVQHAPDLLSYIQVIVDSKPDVHFILSGSSNFLLMEKIGQSLAGRSAILHLLPLSLQELAKSGHEFESYEEAIFTGQYPRIFDKAIDPTDFYPSYIQTYVERDVRLLKNITDLNAFIQFTQLCAGRIGQLLNYSSLANDAGVSPNTAKSWLSVLEAAFVVYRVRPFYKNFNKRLVKSPRLYFYDTGLACSLLGIRSSRQVGAHFLKGGLFENLVINEFVKHFRNQGRPETPYFWRDRTGREIDCMLPTAEELLLVEIKAGKTALSDYFRGIREWRKVTGAEAEGFVAYGGDLTLQTREGWFIAWRDLQRILERLW